MSATLKQNEGIMDGALEILTIASNRVGETLIGWDLDRETPRPNEVYIFGGTKEERQFLVRDLRKKFVSDSYSGGHIMVLYGGESRGYHIDLDAYLKNLD